MNPTERSSPQRLKLQAARTSLLHGPPGIDMLECVRSQGALLLESNDHKNRRGRRTLLFPCPVVRLTFSGEQAVLQPLDPRGEAILLILASRLPSEFQGRECDGLLSLHIPKPDTSSALSDEQRFAAPNILDVLRLLVSIPEDATPITDVPIALGGAFGYDLIDHFEELPPRPDGGPQDDLNLTLSLDGIVIDHQAQETTLVTRHLSDTQADSRLLTALQAMTPNETKIPKATQLPLFESDLSDDAFLAGVESLLESIRCGDIFQGVLSRRLTISSDASTLNVYRALARDNPSPYQFHYDLGGDTLLGASPEAFVEVNDRQILLTPIAGTVPRGRLEDGTIDPEQDARAAVGLLLDAKEQAEHAMLIDLARNDAARVCRPGSRTIESPFTIERFSHVFHLVTQVRGELQDDLDALDAYRATANVGTLTGAPKLRATELLRELEATGRGWYGGAVGFLTAGGDFTTCIVIRSLHEQDGQYTVRAGAGIVADSKPESELAETLHKMHAPLLALSSAEGAIS